MKQTTSVRAAASPAKQAAPKPRHRLAHHARAETARPARRSRRRSRCPPRAAANPAGIRPNTQGRASASSSTGRITSITAADRTPVFLRNRNTHAYQCRYRRGSRLRSGRMEAVTIARRESPAELGVPLAGFALCAGTIAYGFAARAQGTTLGASLAPFLWDWRPVVRPSAIPAVVVLAAGGGARTPAGPRLAQPRCLRRPSSHPGPGAQGRARGRSRRDGRAVGGVPAGQPRGGERVPARAPRLRLRHARVPGQLRRGRHVTPRPCRSATPRAFSCSCTGSESTARAGWPR